MNIARTWTMTMVVGLAAALLPAGGCAEDAPNCDIPIECDDLLDDDSDLDDDPSVPFAVSTVAFADGAVIPLRYECGGAVIQGPGDNISPPLSWTEGPAGTQSYAIVMDDVDSGVVHWVIYDIPADVFELSEDLTAAYELLDPAGAKQAPLQGTSYHGYFGPCSNASVNTYRWTLYAIDAQSVPGASRQTSEYAMIPLIEAVSLQSVSFSGES